MRNVFHKRHRKFGNLE